MANRQRSRKRLSAIRRAPDGSAFENCDSCGVMVAVALADMHECEPKNNCAKRFKGIKHNLQPQDVNTKFEDQPISSFRLFMESFVNSSADRDSIEIDRKGLETWKNMSKQERQPYVCQAEKVNSVYHEALKKEVHDMIEVDDVADSAMVEKFDQFYEEDSKYWRYSGSPCGSFNIDWDILESGSVEGSR